MPGIDDDIITNLENADPTLKDTKVTDNAADIETPSGTAAPTKEPGGSPSPLDGTQPPASRSGGKDNSTQPPVTKAGTRADGATVEKDGSLKFTDGRVIKAGSERRLYEKAQGLETEVGTLKEQIQAANTVLLRVQNEVGPAYDRKIAELQGQVTAYQQAATLPNELKLSPDEAAYGMKVIAAYKANPVQTLQFLLAEAKAQGHNIEGIGSSVDAAAITRMLDQRLAPLTADRQQQERDQVIWDDAGVQANAFFSQHPDAKVHEEHISALMNEDPNLSAESAYYQLFIAVKDRGLDWSKPLRAQLATPSETQPPATRGPALPSGRPGAHNNAQEVNTTIARADAEFSDIVKESMREAGYKV